MALWLWVWVWYAIVEYPQSTIAFWGPHVLGILTVDYTFNLLGIIK